MNNRQDGEFERLSNAPLKRKYPSSLKIIGSILGVLVLTLTYFEVFDSPNVFTNMITEETKGVIMDAQTPEIVSSVPGTDNTFAIKWLSDSMDRGNHDLITSFHGNIIVSKDMKPLERGDILYYQFQGEEQLGRLIGMPGETVEIQEGQVYLDGKKLNTFYGAATSLGLTKDEYFERVDAENVNLEAMENYFNTSMEPVSADENTVFVLVDMWWRGMDSREYGPIPIEQLQGKVLGYEE
ncbi:signal peptidase I [Planomicrobium stackebrandtii]|uniref:Signal peptidase I n=1 Tax=Planomicrobium stackebrandtii TaxID=253160 RepID=A0ABU0GRG9_9BACL|nr:signal peptidase I [Planomicrobium stackebrandtii]MDQ0427210.1 signal peptidase I [Planomicrobium stackebrandtii]